MKYYILLLHMCQLAMRMTGAHYDIESHVTRDKGDDEVHAQILYPNGLLKREGNNNKNNNDVVVRDVLFHDDDVNDVSDVLNDGQIMFPERRRQVTSSRHMTNFQDKLEERPFKRSKVEEIEEDISNGKKRRCHMMDTGMLDEQGNDVVVHAQDGEEMEMVAEQPVSRDMQIRVSRVLSNRRRRAVKKRQQGGTRRRDDIKYNDDAKYDRYFLIGRQDGTRGHGTIMDRDIAITTTNKQQQDFDEAIVDDPSASKRTTIRVARVFSTRRRRNVKRR